MMYLSDRRCSRFERACYYFDPVAFGEQVRQNKVNHKLQYTTIYDHIILCRIGRSHHYIYFAMMCCAYILYVCMYVYRVAPSSAGMYNETRVTLTYNKTYEFFTHFCMRRNKKENNPGEPNGFQGWPARY